MYKRSRHPENADDRLSRVHYRNQPHEHPDGHRTANTSSRVSTAELATVRARGPSPRSPHRRNLCACERAARPSSRTHDGIIDHMVLLVIIFETEGKLH